MYSYVQWNIHSNGWFGPSNDKNAPFLMPATASNEQRQKQTRLTELITSLSIVLSPWPESETIHPKKTRSSTKTQGISQTTSMTTTTATTKRTAGAADNTAR
mmetsp:Transcript_15521/g.33386  ORF Transcript_15521/g.33386 Transcript_15521/m.33386 type:complete len:102 (-) Transcript_15521:1213-1518(-)